MARQKRIFFCRKNDTQRDKNAIFFYKTMPQSETILRVFQKMQKPVKKIALSAAVKPNLVDARYRWYQEWDKWIQDGIIDFVIPMNYFPEIRDFNNSIQIMKSNLKSDDLSMVIMGVATYNQDAQSAADKILLARLNGFQGISVFSWDSHKNNLDWFQPVTEALGVPNFE